MSLLQWSLLFAQLISLCNSVTNGINNAGLKLFLELQTEALENSVMSPFSVGSGLHALLLGSGGATRHQLEEFLETTAQPHLQLQEINNGLKPISEDSTLHIANKVFHHHETMLSENFTKLSSDHLNAAFHSVNFEDEKLSELVTRINSEIKTETNGKISDLLSADTLTEETRMVLVNILYFKGKWKRRFPKHRTLEREFYLDNRDNGRYVMTSTMQIESHIKYLETEDFQSGVLEFSDSGVEMILFKPKNGLKRLLRFILSHDVLERSYGNMQYELVELNLPKFVVRSKYALKRHLSSMGLSHMFEDSKADFSRMTASGSKELTLSEVLHNTFLSLDEEGCEAASATGSIMRLTRSAPMGPEPIFFHLNQPFLYLLRDRGSGVVLFAGTQTSFSGEIVVKKTEL